MQCICGEDLADTADSCPACGLAASTARAVGQAGLPAAIDDGYQWPNFCDNCLTTYPGHHALAQRAELRYCDDCRACLDLINAAHEDLRDRRNRTEQALTDQIAASHAPLPEPATMSLRAIAAEMTAQHRDAGYLPCPRTVAAWVATRHPELEWLACMTAPAIDIHQEALPRRILAERYPDLRPIEWAALLDGAA